MSHAIPVIDLTDYVAGRPGALAVTARLIHDALTQVGFFVITGHDAPVRLMDQTFAEAARLHALPMATKLGMKLNEHNNGYMAKGHYAVWTSDVNQNDKPDLNEAFFIKRERAPDNPLRLSGRRFTGPNVWPDEADLPGFRAYPGLPNGDGRLHHAPAAGCGGGAGPGSRVLPAVFQRQPVQFAAVALPAGGRGAEPIRHRPARRREIS